MKHETIYRLLKDLSEKLNIRFSEKNFRIAGVPVKSGLCKIEGEWHFFMDKHLKIRDKTEILAHAVSQFPLDDMFLSPVLREFIDKNKD